MKDVKLPTLEEAQSQILAAIAANKQKPMEELKPWDDYHPMILHEEASQLASGLPPIRWVDI